MKWSHFRYGIHVIISYTFYGLSFILNTCIFKHKISINCIFLSTCILKHQKYIFFHTLLLNFKMHRLKYTTHCNRCFVYHKNLVFIRCKWEVTVWIYLTCLTDSFSSWWLVWRISVVQFPLPGKRLRHSQKSLS